MDNTTIVCYPRVEPRGTEPVYNIVSKLIQLFKITYTCISKTKSCGAYLS